MFYGSIILFRGESEWFPYLFDVFTEAQKVQIINYKASCFLNLPKSISGGLWHRPMNLRTDGPSILCPGWAVCRRMDTVPVPPIIQSLFSRLPVSDSTYAISVYWMRVPALKFGSQLRESRACQKCVLDESPGKCPGSRGEAAENRSLPCSQNRGNPENAYRSQ